MTILDCVFSGKIYESKLLYELWAFMQTHPSLHILHINESSVHLVTSIISDSGFSCETFGLLCCGESQGHRKGCKFQ